MIVVMVIGVKTTSMENESTEVLCKKKHYLRRQNKVNENKVLYCMALRCETNQEQQKSSFRLCQIYKPIIILN